MESDPFALTVVGNAAGQLLAGGISRAMRLVNQSNDTAPLVNDLHYHLPDLAGEELILTGQQIDAINELLSDPRMTPLVETSCLLRLLITDKTRRAEAATSVEMKFLDMAEANLETHQVPRETAQMIWRALDDQIDRILGDDLADALASDERNKLMGLENTLTVERDRASELPTWLTDLLSLSTDRDRLITLKTRAEEIRRQSLNRFGKLELRHSPDASEGRTLETLYIHRTLQAADGTFSDSNSVFAPATRARIVVTGPPGNGKSTLTQHLIANLSADTQTYVPLLLRVREADLDTNLLTHELADSVRRLYQDGHIEVEHIEDMLTLGRALVIFDGLDEILDKGKRIAFVSKIEAFAHMYPLCSIVATSRENGYEDAPFSKTFSKYKLLPFNSDQVQEYAQKWFGSDPEAEHLVRSFLRDSQAVEELVANPLMLSLLCILYRNRGYIPRNRRAVYKDCADLLFRRWDSMRDIEQPTDHVEHGEDLMEEIALFFFKSQAAQRGVQERQLQGIIAGYLSDSAGVLPGPAKHRAKQFLEFCAGRAWLLGVDGTHAGERLFSFTHRTFMEYFAAEGMVRINSDPAHLANTIVNEYKKNPASVLPDLIVLAAEAGTRGRVRDLLEEIKKSERLIGGKGQGRFLPLRMRIASVLNLQPRHFDLLMVEAFEAFDSGWDNPLSLEVAEAMFRLPRDPRARIEAFVTDPSAINDSAPPKTVRRRQRLLLRAWIEHELNSGESLRGHEWAKVVNHCWDEYLSGGPSNDRWIRFYQRFYRHEAIDLPVDELVWVLKSQRSRTYGPYAIAAMRAIAGLETNDLVDIVEAFGEERGGPRFSYADAYYVAGGVLDALDERPHGLPAASEEEWEIVVVAAMIWWEIHGKYDEFSHVLSEVLGIPFAALVADREQIAARKEDDLDERQRIPAVPSRTKSAVRARVGKACGTWASRWMRDEYNVVILEQDRAY